MLTFGMSSRAKHAGASRDSKGRLLPGSTANPRGRPPRGFSFAEAVRERVDPEVLITRALEILDGADKKLALQAAKFLADRGWGKPIETVKLEALVEAATAPERVLPDNWDSFSLEEKRRHLDRLAPRPIPLVPEVVMRQIPTRVIHEEEL